jgi:hypothetical protein
MMERKGETPMSVSFSSLAPDRQKRIKRSPGIDHSGVGDEGER